MQPRCAARILLGCSLQVSICLALLISAATAQAPDGKTNTCSRFAQDQATFAEMEKVCGFSGTVSKRFAAVFKAQGCSSLLSISLQTAITQRATLHIQKTVAGLGLGAYCQTHEALYKNM